MAYSTVKVQLVRTCPNTNVKPIIGNDMQIVNDAFDAEPLEDFKAYKSPRRYHLIVLAKNTTGYRNLVKLTTIAHLDGKIGKARPCTNKAQLLREHREGLLVSIECLAGEIPANHTVRRYPINDHRGIVVQRCL